MTYDTVIIGAGAAGLMTALSLSPRKVAVIAGGQCASAWAQGGLAAAIDAADTPERHARDTRIAAAGIADDRAVRLLTQAAPGVIPLLEQFGVQFARDAAGNFLLNREACHDHRRVLRAAAGDGFGRELMRALVLAAQNAPHITFISATAERLIVRDRRVQGVVTSQGAITAPFTVIATGGLGGLYAVTTNPPTSVGRGLALAARAGATLSDLEFVQFHPTALDIGEDPAPLATEALRGDGALLVNSRGERFMQAHHPLAELAPRDVVSRAVFAQIQSGQRVYLDCRSLDTAHFPALVSACARANIDPQTMLVPIAPAAHYHMGGIATDLDGRTDVAGLWACGEAAATGLHGANRLASNSLMEAIVMARRVAADILAAPIFRVTAQEAAYTPTPSRDNAAAREELRHLMTAQVGVVRDRAGLLSALETLDTLSAQGDAMLDDMLLVARLIAKAALAREESRGGHCRADFPDTRKVWEKRSFTTLKATTPALESVA